MMERLFERLQSIVPISLVNKRDFVRLLLYPLLVVFFGVFFFKYTRIASKKFSYFTSDHAGTDQLSNIYSTILFWDVGFDVYRKSPAQLLPLMDFPRRKALVREFDWWYGAIFRRAPFSSQVMMFNWAWLPRGYPPGCFLLHAPAALAVLGSQATPLQAVVWLVFVFGIVSVFTSAFFSRSVLAVGFARERFKFAGIAIGASIALAVSFDLIQDGIAGFYDPIAILFLIGAVESYKGKRWDNSLLFYAIALFLHFRASWFFPIPLICLWHIGKQIDWGRSLKKITQSSVAKIAASVILGGISSYSFLLLNLNAQRWAVSNPFFIMDTFDASFVQNYYAYLVIFYALWYCLYRKLFTAAVVILSMSVLWTKTPQVWHHHALHLIPLILLFGEKNRMQDLLGGFAFYYLISKFIFAHQVLDVTGKFLVVLLS